MCDTPRLFASQILFMSLFGEYLDSPNESFFFQEAVHKSKSKNKQEAVLKRCNTFGSKFHWLHVIKSYPKIISYERKFKNVKYGDEENYTYIY